MPEINLLIDVFNFFVAGVVGGNDGNIGDLGNNLAHDGTFWFDLVRRWRQR